MRRGLTTHEDCKYIYEGNQASPFTRFSYCANFSRTIFKRLSKNLFDPEMMYKDLDIKVGSDMNGTERDNLSDKAPDHKEKISANIPVHHNQIQIIVNNDN